MGNNFYVVLQSIKKNQCRKCTENSSPKFPQLLISAKDNWLL